MAREGPFVVEGVIIETLPNGTYRVELPNGHRLLGFVTGKARQAFAAVTGQKVTVQLSPFDLSEGRILPEMNLK
ncbi:MAG TPA: translation initiation factor IF-1 [Verrucomicrobiae bacterium]|nr:translation initiation factor IF-1 [Verrucomicrobiae bacterium]